MKKKYISITGTKLTFPVRVAGRVTFISLNDSMASLSTSDIELQNAIEASVRFQRGLIVLEKGEPNVQIENPPAVEVLDKKNTEVVPVEVKEPIIIPEVKTAPVKEEASKEKVHAGIKDAQSASAILRKEYGVPHQSVRGLQAVKNKANELGVSFPDLV